MIFHQPHNSKTNQNYNAFFYTDAVWDIHFHKNLELIYVVRGCVNCTVNNIEYKLYEGDFGLALPYDIHSYTPCDDTLYWVGVFSEDYVRQFSKQVGGKIANGFRFRCDEVTLEMLKSILINQDRPSTLRLKSCLYAICDAFLSSITLSEAKTEKKRTVIMITDYILQNHTSNITLKDIARLLGYDYNYVSRYFHTLFNMSFKDLVNMYRLETAVRLIDETDKKMTDIALESGFQSIRTFNDTFRKHFGINPSEHKKKTKTSL